MESDSKAEKYNYDIYYILDALVGGSLEAKLKVVKLKACRLPDCL